jgi:hypothetical protein
MSECGDLSTVKRFADVAQDIASQSDVKTARRRVVELAQSMLGHGGAALWYVSSKGQLLSDAATDADFEAHLRAMDRWGNGPAAECIRTRSTIDIPDVEAETRWPDFITQLTRATSVRSAVVFHLGVEHSVRGVLMVYADKPNAFTVSDVELGGLFASIVTPAFGDVYNGDHARNLAAALDSNRKIGVAVGVLMTSHKVSEAQAFDLLRIASQNTHSKLRDVADEIVFTGALPANTRAGSMSS